MTATRLELANLNANWGHTDKKMNQRDEPKGQVWCDGEWKGLGWTEVQVQGKGGSHLDFPDNPVVKTSLSMQGV